MIYVYADSSVDGALACSIDGCCVCSDNEIAGGKNDVAIVKIDSDERKRLAIGMLRKKIAVAVLNATSEDMDWLHYFGSTALRNKIQAAVLGSWRYIPTVAALKEISDSGVLGNNIRFAAGFYGEMTAIDRARMNDAAFWLANAKYSDACDCLPEYDAAIRLEGENGVVIGNFKLDGQAADLSVCLAGHCRRRIVPKAWPLQSELAVLSVALSGFKISRAFDMLMDARSL